MNGTPTYVEGPVPQNPNQPMVESNAASRLAERLTRLAGDAPAAKQLRDPKTCYKVVSSMWGKFRQGHVFVRDDVLKFNSALPEYFIPTNSVTKVGIKLTPEQRDNYLDQLIKDAFKKDAIRMTMDARMQPPEESRHGDILAGVIDEQINKASVDAR